MAKVNVSYFQLSKTHYNNMRALKVRQKYGTAGYGLYVILIQKLASAPERKLSLLDIPQLVFELRLSDDTALKEIIEWCFQITPDNYFHSDELEDSVQSLIKKVSNLNPSAAGKASAEARRLKKLEEDSDKLNSESTGEKEE